ncbi:PSME3-interacting protein-like [Oscarella lobularis]|uniref:PSME3-interacting protein-like n=1 Tax=Oscarella lobularis TaxID=121494 RepID=UPI003313E861
MSELKSFESQDDIDDRRRRRQEEWEKARRPDEPEKCPEEIPWDGKTLYQRLQEQKEEKQLEWEEQFKFKNMIYKGLDEDEAKFLNVLSENQAKQEHFQRREEKKYLEAYREALQKEKAEESLISDPKTLMKRSTVSVRQEQQSDKKKSQQALLTGSIVRKRKSTGTEDSDAFSKQSKSEAKSGATSDVKPSLVSYGSESESDDN